MKTIRIRHRKDQTESESNDNDDELETENRQPTRTERQDKVPFFGKKGTHDDQTVQTGVRPASKLSVLSTCEHQPWAFRQRIQKATRISKENPGYVRK